jgi:hypothetical protein
MIKSVDLGRNFFLSVARKDASMEAFEELEDAVAHATRLVKDKHTERAIFVAVPRSRVHMAVRVEPIEPSPPVPKPEPSDPQPVSSAAPAPSNVGASEGSSWGKVAMTLATLALLLSLAYAGFEHRETIIDLYRAAYPNDPAKRDALDQCSRWIPNFNRLYSADQANCYAIISARVIASAKPIDSGYLPANDIRREEAFDGYRSSRGASLISTEPSKNVR